MTTNNQMRQQGYNGGAGTYTSTGFKPARYHSSGSNDNSNGCVFVFLVGILVSSGIGYLVFFV